MALPAFPSIDRDLTVLVDEATPWSAIERAIHEHRTESLDLLEAVEFVTVFRGGRIATGRKALTLRLRFRAADRTLRHQEVDPGVATVTAALEGIGGEIPR